MARKGLNREFIINQAVFMIEETGFENFSMHSLAKRMGVKTASLYNHIQNIDELYGEVGINSSKKMGVALSKEIEGRDKETAVMEVAAAYRRFVKNHTELYEAIMYLPQVGETYVQKSSFFPLTPIMRMLSMYNLSDKKKLHLQRIFRAIMHGFLAQEKAGFFSQTSIDCEESYCIAISAFIEQLKKMEDAKDERG